MNRKELFRAFKEYCHERYKDGYEHGLSEGKKQAKVNVTVDKFYQMAYDDGMKRGQYNGYVRGFEAGKRAAIEIQKIREELPYDAMGEHEPMPTGKESADDWYHAEFGGGK